MDKGDVIVQLIGGLGNQMFQYASALAIARATHRRLVMDTSLLDKRIGNRRLELGIFPTQGTMVRQPPWQVQFVRKIERHTWFNGIPFFILGATPVIGMRVVRDQEIGFSREPYQTGGRILLEGYWQSWKYFNGISELIRQSFRFPETCASESSRNIKSMADNCNSIAVHVRRGDYLGLQQQYAICEQEYYLRAARIVASKVTHPVFFVFGDGCDSVWECLRLQSDTHIVSRNREGSADWEDLWLMSQCKHLIIANSTFSWWAAWLCTGAHKIVVAPARWYSNNREHKLDDLLPKSWIRVP